MAQQGELAFGTSGLRGHADQFTPETVAAYVGAMLSRFGTAGVPKQVVLGHDLRASSPRIAQSVGAAIEANGFAVLNAGAVPTPALAQYGLAQGVIGIMVTGSHIPAQYNGLKFYTPTGELLKADEAAIAEAVAQRTDWARPSEQVDLPPVLDAVQANYANRFLVLGSDCLAGMRLGVFAHSAVGRDLLVKILAGLGAECIAFGRSETFVAVDTEAVSGQDLQAMRAALDAHELDAVVSTDGDGDRPLLIDGEGHQVNGDVLGALTAHWLGARHVVTPLTSTSAIEKSGWFTSVERTRIGSPYVVAAMDGAGTEGVVGFEANGGFLTGSALTVGGTDFAPLPTRDAVLPLVGVLVQAARQGLSVARLVETLPARAMVADRLKEVAPRIGLAIVETLAQSQSERSRLDPMLATPVAIDTTDGTRFELKDGRIVHFRQSGNAPELRCYVETDTRALSAQLLDRMMAGLSALVGEAK